MADGARSRLVELPGDRVVEVWEGGDAAGVPVVFHHGTPSGRLQARLGEGAARRLGVRLVSFNRPVYGVPEQDAGWLTEENKRLFGLDLRDTLRSYDGYARDNVAWGGEWDIDPAQLEVPTWLWFGDLDQMVPPSHGRWYADRVPNSTLVPRLGKGHGSTLFEYWDDMLTTLTTT